MKLSTRLSRSNGYRELGMFDESILELEAIEFGEDRWHPLVIEARYKTYRDAKEWELAKIMADLLTKRFPDQVEWLINKSEAMREMGDPPGAIQALKDAQDRFPENAEYLFRLAKYHAILGNVEEAKKLVKQAIKKDAMYKLEFVEDSAFDKLTE
jgi:tetratricopeptide (TPR) repeat protein